MSSVPADIKLKLQEIIDNDETFIQFNVIQSDQKDFQYTAVRLEVKKVQEIEKLYQFCKSLIPQLKISKNGVRYYAELVENYYASRLRKMNESQQWLYLTCFIFNRYQQFMDNLIITFQYHMNSILDNATNYANAASMEYSANLALDFPKLAKFLKWFPSKEKDNANITYTELIKEAYAILPKSQFELLAAFIEGKIFDKTMAKWQFYKKSSGLFSRYLRPVMLSVGFELADSKSNVIELIKLLKTHYSKRKNPAALMVKISSDIGRTVPKWLIPYINNNSNLEYFDPYRLEFYVYWRMSHYITKGRLVCNDSVSYGDLDQDLIPEYLVDNVEEIAAKFGYLKIPIYCDARLDEALARN